MIGMIGYAERIIFCGGTCTRKHVVYELCAGEGVCPYGSELNTNNCTHIILLKKACIYNTCSNSRPCASLHVWYRRSNDRPTLPSNRSSSSNPLLLLPPKKNQGALNEALRNATTEWGLTAQIIISSAYINRWSVGSSAWRTHLDTCT